MAQEAELVPQPHGGALRKGNPGKRTTKVTVRKAFEAALNETGDTGILAGIIRDAQKGDKDARRIVLEYAIGKPETRVEVSGADGGPIVLSPVLASLSDDELQDRIKKLEG
jgi:hypothetical protein